MAVPASTVEQFRALLVQHAGGFLRNTLRESRVTCAVCATPCPGYDICIQCRKQLQVPGQRADQVASLTYAVGGRQAGYMMRNYKATPPVKEHVTLVMLTAVVGLALHGDCAGRRLRSPVTHWAAIPSLPAKPGQHPLRALVHAAAPGEEVWIGAAEAAPQPRAVDPDHFRVGSLPAGAHMLLIDDTWTGGGHAQSAVLAARAAGAARVSVLNISRWIDGRWKIDEYGNNDGFMAQRCTADYDPSICPWTGGACPP